ncbi:MAG: transposase family protein [Cytophagales bacterium]|nr:transposase family protein [Cytophagales bacterium]
MEAKMSLKARLELLERVKERYKVASRQQKHQILQEFVESTGYHRKYALALLSKERVESVPTKRRSSHVKYTEEVQEALIYVWKAANEICPKRLIPFMPVFIDSLERTGHWPISESAKSLLLTLSTATAERLLRRERMQSNRGRSTTRAGKLLKKQIPIRTFSDWNDVEPGFLEADLVAHCGDNVHGAYLNTLTLTDIFSGWTECMALLQRGEREVSEGLTESRPQLPFPLRGLDTDNGSEFINFVLFDYCQAENITFTRSRPYKKNDQAHVEEKNGSVVRRMVGYDRYEGQEAQSALKTLYQSLRLYVNFFQPSMKLLSKKRDGAKVSKNMTWRKHHSRG